MTRETAEKAAALLQTIIDADRVLKFIESQDELYFGLPGSQHWKMPVESVAGATRTYRKLKEFAEAELQKL